MKCFVSVIFEAQTAAKYWVWSPRMCRLRVLTGSNATVLIISNIENHVFETKLLYIFIKSNCIETISLLFMVPNIWNYLNSCNWTGQYSQSTHSRWPNSRSGRGFEPQILHWQSISCIFDHSKSKSSRPKNLTDLGNEFDFLSVVWCWSKITFILYIYTIQTDITCRNQWKNRKNVVLWEFNKMSNFDVETKTSWKRFFMIRHISIQASMRSILNFHIRPIIFYKNSTLKG